MMLNYIVNTDALTFLKTLPTDSVDAVITDPPYAEVDRDYGRLSEADWFDLMMPVTDEIMRVVKPSGSAALILQPNMEKIGKTRLWLWRYLVWAAEKYNLVQDLYWWNFTTIPTSSVSRGLTRSSVKPIIWLGDPNCYRNQDAVLWEPSDTQKAMKKTSRVRHYAPSRMSVNKSTFVEAVERRGGVTPFNLIPFCNADSKTSAGAFGHSAGTPYELTSWLMRYLVPENGIVCDPFMGSGTTAIVAKDLGRSYLGSEKERRYWAISMQRLGLSETVTSTAPLSIGAPIHNLPLEKSM